ncbi:MAG: hypothetical protein J3T61_01330 [Candidatus Brocadiales bacterium]|nr:hypothetical protein [Candidatus Bathyanammoxibius sp.]
MIRATLATRKVRRMDELVLHKWLESQGFNTANRIKRTKQTDGLTLFEQFPAPSFRIRPNLSEFIDTKAEDRNKLRWEKEGRI